MNVRELLPKFVIFISMLVLLSCLLPGMIPLDSEPEGRMPVMEEDTDKVIEVLQSEDRRFLSALVEEQYPDEDYARPVTLTFSADVSPEDLPVYFSYGWCATDEETLRQNFEHIDVRLSINGNELGEDVVHNLTYTSPTGMVCLDFGVLMTEWPAGEYKLEAVATFDESINDGVDDFDAGDYVFIYTVTVSEQKEGGETPS